MKKYIGVDLGGTNVRVAVITEDGEILAQLKSPSYAKEGREKVLDNLYSLIKQLPDWDKCDGIGAGVPGPVNQALGAMMLDTNLPGFKNFPFAKDMTEKLGIPSFIDNDANVAGLAEALLGAGKGYPVVYYTTLSTGIGGALIVDGKCVGGKHGFGGEIANIIIDRNREKVNYLNAGAVENEASGTAVVRKGRAALGEDVIKHAGQVFDLANKGNEKAKAIVEEVTGDLAQLYATLAGVCDPDIFVLGGGMMNSADDILPKVIEKYKAITHEALHDTPFAVASLEEPGIVGAAMLPRSKGI